MDVDILQTWTTTSRISQHIFQIPDRKTIGFQNDFMNSNSFKYVRKECGFKEDVFI